MDEALRLSYLKEDQAQSMITVFAFLSLIIALLGLFGLSAFALERRTKETGIRKVNGARPVDILFVLNPAICRLDTDRLFNCSPAFMVCHASMASAFCLSHGDFMVDIPAGIFHINTGSRYHDLLADISRRNPQSGGGVEI